MLRYCVPSWIGLLSGCDDSGPVGGHFGSYVTGRSDPLTDLDLFVVLDSDLPFVERTALLYRELAPRVACDILAYTPQEWMAMQERPFVRDALTKGEVL